MIKTIDDLKKIAKKSQTKKLVLCAAGDEHSLEAVIEAKKENVVEPVLVGDKAKIKSVADKLKLDINDIEILHENNLSSIVQTSVKYISQGGGDILMKGNLGSADILKGVLNKEWGLRKNPVLSHLAVFEIPEYHKLLALSDAAMNIEPNLKEKIGIINNSVDFLANLGIKIPKISVISPVEVVNEHMQSTMDAALLSIMQRRGQIKNCIIDGPLSFDNAISMESKEHKGITGDVAGDSDMLLAHDINAGNVMYKSFVFFAKARLGAVILGAKSPIVLTSRSDSEDTKFNSILLSTAVNN